MITLKRFSVILLAILYVFLLKVNAQNFEWLKKYNSGYVNTVSSNLDSNLASLFIYREGNTPNFDTLTFDSIQFISTNTIPNIYSSFVLKHNPKGKVIAALKMEGVWMYNMCTGKDNAYYLIGQFKDSVTLNSQQYLSKNGRLLFIKLDQQLNFTWIRQTLVDTFQKLKIFNSDNRVYFICETAGAVKFGNNHYNFEPFHSNLTNYTTVFGEINQFDGKFKWTNYFFNNNGGQNLDLNHFVKLNSQLFFVGQIGVSFQIRPQVIIKNDTLADGGFLIKTDSLGTYIRSLKIGEHVSTIASDGKKLYISGNYSDSIKWNQKVYKTGYQGTYSNCWGVFLGSLDSNLNKQWFYSPKNKITTPKNTSGTAVFYNAIYDKAFLYFSGGMSLPIEINNQSISPTLASNGFYNSDILILKMDLLGNPLWARNAGTDRGVVMSMSVFPEKHLFLGGSFIGTFKLGQFVIKSSFQSPNGFITKISDNAIIRGSVSAGPYCAGDTIKIPYIKIGDYDTSNYFIAELSDEQGNFNGAHRELGRLKSNQDSSISGLLPLFKVGSSEKYRIRILSTAPAVQSYYKVDTLRLLIYSRDKANAGNDTTICKGDSLLLRTYGGTKWTWSPKYKMKDSTARETMVWPDVSTTYKIIIADSSGCGEADTAFKTIYVRNELSVRFYTPIDTTVCIGGTMPLIASFHGGDSLGYSWQWASIDASGNHSFLKTSSGKQADTFLYTMPPGEKDSMRFILYLGDGCTPKTAFYTYTLKVRKTPTQGLFAHADTALCPGTAMPAVIHFTGAPAGKLSWLWQENNSFNQWIQRRSGSNKPSDTWLYTLPLNWKGLKKIRVTLSDACSGLKDTAVMNITPRDTLKLSLNTGDTKLCKGQSFTWKASGKDGYAPGYKYVWIDILSGDTLSLADTLRMVANKNKHIRVNLQDGCMPKSVEKSITITVHPELNSDILFNNTTANDTVLCYGQSIDYKAAATGGKSSGYTYRWLLGGTQINTQDQLQLALNDYKSFAGGKTRLLLITSDGCTLPDDSSEIEIDLLAPLAQSVNYPDSICHGSSAQFKTIASGGKGNYTFKWMDDASDILSNTDAYAFLHSSTQTGIINHRVLVSDGCSFNDTTIRQSELLGPLRLTISASDPCPADALALSAITSGGKASAHLIRWYNNGILIGSGGGIGISTGGLSRTITAILSDGCSNPPDTQTISTGSRPGVQISASDICMGDETSLLASSTNAAKAQAYQWRIDGLLQSTADSLLRKTFAATGNYSVKVTAISGGNCNGNDSVNVEIIAKPEADFDFVHFNAQVPIPFQFNNRSLYSQSWIWNFGTGDTSMRSDPLYKFGDTGRFKIVLIASNQGKCFDTAIQIIPVYPSIEFYFPNAFSPNGNRINEHFGLQPAQWFMVKAYNLKIFNRWGEMVFNSDHMEEPWDGNGAQQGVYIWKAEIRDVYNVLHELKGVVEVMR